MSEVFAAVDALIARAQGGGDLPEPAERRRLREAAGFTQEEVAAALGVRRETFVKWEAGSAQPRAPRRGAYAWLLAGLAGVHGTEGPDGWLRLARTAKPADVDAETGE
ncbi:hypothetical protein GCM10009665_28620 [Kitasatospora nipponensis]|uniref:HTH cro/C1-type domain-containing protein n=1 Tax=Kitasatospora nipponensis TaxID=258049 RepID=A0ABP4GV50_9ACTN